MHANITLQQLLCPHMELAAEQQPLAEAKPGKPTADPHGAQGLPMGRQTVAQAAALPLPWLASITGPREVASETHKTKN